jgi:hypothetical protein
MDNIFIKRHCKLEVSHPHIITPSYVLRVKFTRMIMTNAVQLVRSPDQLFYQQATKPVIIGQRFVAVLICLQHLYCQLPTGFGRVIVL